MAVCISSDLVEMIRPPGYKPLPATPLQWVTEWTTKKSMEVPSSTGREVRIELTDIKPVDPQTVWGNPDLLMTTNKGKRFYVLFQVGSVFHPMDLPLLVYPPDKGVRWAFWVMPAWKGGA